jgi:hypothetical protein
MLSALYDPQIVQTYHDEYLKLLTFYQNAKRPSVFIRYFNIDTENSTYDDKLDATYDLYHVSNIKFNIYDFTPTSYVAPVVNAAANVPDLRGQMMDATSSIVTYTIAAPRIHDIVMFYGPTRAGEIFRVTGLRIAVSALHTEANIKTFELELEYAPIKTTEELKILGHYVYDLTDEKYITYNDYKDFERRMTTCEKILDELMTYYDSYNDLYQSNQLAPIEVNEVIIFFKKFFAVKYKRIYEKYKFPYGYLDKMNFTQQYSSVEDLPFVMGNYTFHVYNLTSGDIEEYSWSVTHKEAVTDLDKMFLLSYQLLQEAFSWKL